MTFGGDFLRDEAAPMAEFLAKKGVACEMKIYGDEKTGHVTHVNVRSPIAREANDDEVGFMMRYVR